MSARNSNSHSASRPSNTVRSVRIDGKSKSYTRAVISAPGSRVRRAGVLLVTLAFALVLTAKASALTPPDEMAALASGRAIGLTTDSCGGGHVMSAISDDRGATWRPGQCVPEGDAFRIQPDSDGVSVSYQQVDGQALVQLDANGAVSASWPTEGYIYASGVDGSQAFVWTFTRGIVSVSATGTVPCGATANVGANEERWIAAIGPLVVVAGSPPGGQSVEFAISNDSCASFTPVSVNWRDCTGYSLWADGSLLCSQDDGAIRLDAHDPAAGWAPAVVPTAPGVLFTAGFGLARGGERLVDAHNPTSGWVPSLAPGVVLTRGGLEVHPLDEASFSWAQWTWPKPVRTFGAITGGAPPPRGAMSSALAYLNTRYRRPMGLADAVWQPQIALSAQRHADYWVKNGTGTGLQPHDETPGKPGFYGVTAADRCKAAGVPDAIQCGEDAAPYRTTPLAAMGVLLALPYHGVPLLSALHLGLGESTAGVAVEMDGSWNVDQSAGVNVFDYDAVPNTPSATEHVWPFDGADNVPSRGGRGEVPDPLAGYTGDHANVGPILFYSTLNPVQVTLKTKGGATVPLVVPPQVFTKAIPHGPVQSVTSKGGFVTEAVFAGRALVPGASYTLTLSPELPGLPERHFTFTVALSPNNTLHSNIFRTYVGRCTEVVTSSLRDGGTRVAYHFKAVGCTPQALQVKRAGAWHSARAKVVVVHRGTAARWRVVYRKRVIALGVLHA